MRVNTRVLLGYSPALAILALVLALMIGSGSERDRSAEWLYARTIPTITAGERLLSLAREMDEQAYRYVVAGNSPIGRRAMARFDADLKTFEAFDTSLRTLATGPGQRRDLGRIDRALGVYLALDEHIRLAVRQKDPRTASWLKAEDSTRAYARLVTASESLVHETEALVNRERLENLRERDRVRHVAVWSGLLALLLAAATGWRLARSLSVPIAALQRETERIEAGEAPSASANATIEGIGELASLRQAIVRMATSLEHGNQALVTANSRLESRVAERTAALDAAKRDLEGMVAELRALDQLKSNFMAIVSHELLTPLNFIEGFASALEDGVLGPLEASQREAVGKIVAGSERLTRMVRNTLEYTQLESGTLALMPVPTDYRALVLDVVASFAERARAKGQTLETQLPDGPLSVVADPDRLAQVLGELLDNAIKFNANGGRVSVTVSRSPGAVNSDVCDAGSGIAEQVIARLAMPFYQADSSLTRRHGGLGLGLAIASRLSARMGGRLEARSAPERGTCFRLVLPVDGTV